MIIKKAELTAVAVSKAQYPADDMPEIAFVGRSNVGKSSLLNLLVNRKSLARVSGTPGKTRTINFYEVNGEFRIVDLPGYGYAKVSKSVSSSWDDMMDSYFKSRKKLIKAVQIVDIRHAPSALDIQMHDYLKYFGLDGIIVAAKADKVSRNEAQQSLATIRRTLGLAESGVIIPVSALKRAGHEELLAKMGSLLLEAR